MKIEISRGCTAFYNEINEKDMFEYSLEALQTVLLTICSSIEDKQELMDTICTLTENLGSYEGSDDPCDQCGDYVEKWTLEI